MRTTLARRQLRHQERLPPKHGGIFLRKGGMIRCRSVLTEITPGREVWFGRIGSGFSFGPTTQARAKAAVEAKLSGHSFEKQEGEKSRLLEIAWRPRPSCRPAARGRRPLAHRRVARRRAPEMAQGGRSGVGEGN